MACLFAITATTVCVFVLIICFLEPLPTTARIWPPKADPLDFRESYRQRHDSLKRSFARLDGEPPQANASEISLANSASTTGLCRGPLLDAHGYTYPVRSA